MTNKPNNWSREQLLVAFNLYCQLPFGKMHSRNPDIVHFAKLIGRTPSALAMKLTNIASLDPAIVESGRKGLSGASATDSAMWSEMQRDWSRFSVESQSRVDALIAGSDVHLAEPLTTSNDDISNGEIDFSAEDKIAQTRIRVGQQFFRRSVISAYQGRCCITGLTEARLLVASHIVPWRSDKINRLNPRNGLCLSVLHDKAFDQGFFTLTPDFRIRNSTRMNTMVSNSFAIDWLVGLEGKTIEIPQKFRPLESFLDWHSRNVFLGV